MIKTTKQELLDKDYVRFKFKDLLKFGEYLLSKDRRDNLLNNNPNFWEDIDKVNDTDVQHYFQIRLEKLGVEFTDNMK